MDDYRTYAFKQIPPLTPPKRGEPIIPPLLGEVRWGMKAGKLKNNTGMRKRVSPKLNKQKIWKQKTITILTGALLKKP